MSQVYGRVGLGVSILNTLRDAEYKPPRYVKPIQVRKGPARALKGRDRNKPCPCGSGNKAKKCCRF